MERSNSGPTRSFQLRARPTLAEAPSFEALPTVTVLRSPAIAAFKSANGLVWEIGWNGIWVKRCVE
jgi:hypothetical protein